MENILKDKDCEGCKKTRAAAEPYPVMTHPVPTGETHANDYWHYTEDSWARTQRGGLFRDQRG